MTRTRIPPKLAIAIAIAMVAAGLAGFLLAQQVGGDGAHHTATTAAQASTIDASRRGSTTSPADRPAHNRAASRTTEARRDRRPEAHTSTAAPPASGIAPATHATAPSTSTNHPAPHNAPATRAVAPAAGNVAAASTRPIDETETVHITGRDGPFIIQRGAVTGSPLGHASVVMRDRLSATGVAVSFTVSGPGGSIAGQARAQLRVRGSTVFYGGTAHLTGGTGRYAKVRAPKLELRGTGDLAGRTIIHVTGAESY